MTRPITGMTEEADGTRAWRRRGRLHRGGDLPAVERADGTREWWEYGELKARRLTGAVNSPAKKGGTA